MRTVLKTGYLFSGFALWLLFEVTAAWAVEVKEIRVWDSPERTRFVFDVSNQVFYSVLDIEGPDRLIVDVLGGKFTGKIPKSSKLGPHVKRIRVGTDRDKLRFVFDLKHKIRPEAFSLGPNEVYGDRLVVDVYPKDKGTPKKKRKASKRNFTVVIDAGHGGEDPGAVGYKRTLEKKLVLNISKQLQKKLNAQPGIRAEMTRTGDYYITLRRRNQIAVEKDADLFVSIHADSFGKKSANGISVFALSQRGATSERARVLANKENSSDLIGGKKISTIDNELALLLTDLTLSEQIDRSVDLGEMVRTNLGKLSRLHGHAVEQAGFVVLKNQVPSVLIEVGFISNPGDAKRLLKKSYQKKLVNEITRAIVRYAKKYPWNQDNWRAAIN